MAPDFTAVTMTIGVDIHPGCEAQFTEWGEALLRELGRRRGHLGGGIIGYFPAGGDWRLGCRFETRSDVREWESSVEWSYFLSAAASFAGSVWIRRAADVREWFVVAPPPAVVPPKWKSAVVTLVAVFPPVMLFNLTLIPVLRSFSIVLRTLALCVAVTMVVTWVMMPRLMRTLRPWLQYRRPPVERGWELAFRAEARRGGGWAGEGRRLGGPGVDGHWFERGGRTRDYVREYDDRAHLEARGRRAEFRRSDSR